MHAHLRGRGLERAVRGDEAEGHLALVHVLHVEDELAGAAEAFDGVWNVLTSAEREALVREVVLGVEYDAGTESITVTFKDDAGEPAQQQREVA